MKNFKKYILIIVLIVVPFLTIAAQEANNKEVEEFDVNGIKVLLKHSPKEVISAKLYIKGGTANYSKEQEGIENFALNLVISGGTTSLDKIAFSTVSDKIGVRIGVNSDYDFGSINLTCVKQYWDESWNLFSDIIMNPAFDLEEYTNLKENLISQAKQTMSDPDSELRNLAMGNVFKGKNYAKIPKGTAESLPKISLENLKKYYTDLLGRKRIFIVVVGNIKKEDLKSKVEASFAKLPEGSSPVIEKQTIIVEPSNLIEDRDIATNYIRGYMSAPKMNSKEGVAMMVAMSILSERLFIEIRTKRGLSYAPASFYANGIINSPYNAIYVSTIDPKQSIEVMVDEINKLRKVGFTPKELSDVQQSFLTNHYMGLETMDSQSGNLGLAELKGNWKMAEEFANIVNDISLDDINSAIKKYTESISWTYLGKKDMINEADFLQPVKLLEIPIKN
ncbi:MAG: hypothetical protein CVU01_01580 [Bacteroidetes bacterium HGW-Bacteroidetes-18]|nr:MAG: hypothetical protein CVU01_01580 [Bacteroidetes bacterium HGW-Bacteroidetes-18]